jgi:hypothetical protein
MSFNPWDDDSKCKAVDAASQKWFAIVDAVGGGLAGLWHSPPLGIIVGAFVGVIVMCLVQIFFFGLVVVPLLMFVYGFVEVFRAIIGLFSSKRK